MTPTASFFSLKSQGHISINKQYFFFHSNSAGVQEKPLYLFLVAFPFGFLLTGLRFLCISRCVRPCCEETSPCSERICWIFPVGIGYVFVTELSTDIPNRKKKRGPGLPEGIAPTCTYGGPPPRASEYLDQVLEGEMPSVVPDGSPGVHFLCNSPLNSLLSVDLVQFLSMQWTISDLGLLPCGST